jgi:hypothetical protein
MISIKLCLLDLKTAALGSWYPVILAPYGKKAYSLFVAQ